MSRKKDTTMHTAADGEFAALMAASSLRAPHVRALSSPIPGEARSRMRTAAKAAGTIDSTQGHTSGPTGESPATAGERENEHGRPRLPAPLRDRSRQPDCAVGPYAGLLTTVDPQRHEGGHPPQTQNLEPNHPQIDTTPAAETSSPRRTGVCLVPGRGIGRAADSAVRAAEALQGPGRDLRTMSPSDRAQTSAAITQWRELLSTCPAGAFGAEGSTMVLTAVAAVSQTLIADRDEHTALRLIRTAFPHLLLLGSCHPAVFEVRRTWAEALSELGRHRHAEKMLRRLGQDEQQVWGRDDPRTALLLLWTLLGSGRLRQAEQGFHALENRLATPSQGADTPTLWHVQCRYSWLQGRRGLIGESTRGYDGVIINRSHQLGPDHPDTHDARHSKGKMYVCAGAGSQAITLLQILAEDRARIQGDRHPDTLETLKYLHLAHVQAEPQDDRVVHRAISDLEHILRLQQRRHGPGHPMNRDTAAWLHKLQEHIRSREAIADLRQIPRAQEEGQSPTGPPATAAHPTPNRLPER